MLKIIDYFMTAVFTIEMLLKIVVFGFITNGPESYMRVGWNLLDGLIVVSALLTAALSGGAVGKSLKVLRILRILRVLRPLRVISRNKGLKLALMALIKSIPALVDLIILIVFFLFLFAILHTALFGGLFWHCKFDHLRSNGSLSIEQV